MVTFIPINFSFEFQALNETLSNNNVPLEIVKAYVGEINISIPWTSLLRDNSLLDIKGLEITVRPKRSVDQSNIDDLVL